MGERNLIYLINPISGTRNKDTLRNLITSRNNDAGYSFSIYDTVADGDYTFLRNKVKDESITDVIVCGGDGSINQIASALYGIDVNVGIIPMGSGNGLAFAAGIPKNFNKAIDIIFNNNAEYIDAFNVNDQFCCMLCGLGFDAQVAHDFASQKKRGLKTYLKLTTKNFFKASTYKFEIIQNETTINTEAFFISIANSNQFGNHLTIAPKASLSDGLLDVVVVNKMSKIRMVYAMACQLLMGDVMPIADKKARRKNIYYFQTESLIVRNPDNAPFHIDGEPRESSPDLSINVIKRAFRLLHPNV